jgi:two-component system chemotaxis response regulator CheY
MILIANGFEIIDTANNGLDAIQKYDSFESKPDIILMDYRMPIKNGIEATREILKIDQNSKVVITTADITIENEAMAIGVKSFLKKPFDIGKLVDTLNNIL